MKRILWAVLGLASLSFLIWNSRPAPKAVPAAPVPIARERVEEKAVPPATTPLAGAKTPKPSENSRPEPPPEAIAFVVDGDLAIAQGDIILGTVENDEKVEEGYYKPFRPRLWDSNEIPYHIDEKLPEPDRVRAALKQMESQTTLKFVPFTGQEDALVFVRGDRHCYSYLGRIGGHQPVQLADTCSPAAILHEVMHALGFIHEHSRTDRDEYVQVEWENVEDQYAAQFEEVPETLMDPIKGTPFDFNSIMLYPPNAFAKDPKKPTLVSITGVPLNPQNTQLSAQDVERVQRLYP